MPPRTLTVLRSTAARLILCAAVAGTASLVVAAEEAVYLGSARCIDCHTQPSPLRQRDGATDWVALTEAHTWLETDKHSQAFEVLDGDLAKQMGARLGMNATTDRRCLSCHAGWAAGNTASTTTEPPPRFELGVSCEACHGPSSLYDQPHTEPAWRARSAAEKALLGMIDVRDAAYSVRQCLSCHLGNAAEGKLLTHAMYAAGHPPLPGFELTRFAASMPPHWRELAQKGEQVRADPRTRAAVRDRQGDLPRVRSLVVGGVAGLRQAVRLYRDWQSPSGARSDWPDFAQYDCAACHHELERPSWRRNRPSTGRPGQLFAPRWPAVLAELGVRHLQRHDPKSGQEARRDFNNLLNGYLSLDEAERTAACGRLCDCLDELLPRLGTLPFDDTAAHALLIDVSELGQQPYLDFDSARQLGWTAATLLSATGRDRGGRLEQHVLADLTSLLDLDLPSTRDRQILDPRRQRKLYDALGDYQPANLNNCFSRLANMLK